MKLVKPNVEYHDGIINYAKDFLASGNTYYYDKYKAAITDFDAYLTSLVNISYDHNEGYQTYWLVNDDVILGVVRIRYYNDPEVGHIGYDISPLHRKKGYGTLILQLALEKAKTLGHTEIFLTCNLDNNASKRVIINNGGVYVGRIYRYSKGYYMDKYQINLNIKTSS